MVKQGLDYIHAKCKAKVPTRLWADAKSALVHQQDENCCDVRDSVTVTVNEK
jgi:hypothetical protein